MSNLNVEGNVSNKRRISRKTSIIYDEQRSGVFGTLTISGIIFPHNNVFDVLGKIWSSVRKRIENLYHVGVTGTFVYEEEKKSVVCHFYLNYAAVDEDKHQEYEDDFLATFHLGMLLFEEAIESFLLDDDGMKKYTAYVKSSEDINYDKCDEILNEFLKKINIKTDDDEKKKQELKEKKNVLRKKSPKPS